MRKRLKIQYVWCERLLDWLARALVAATAISALELIYVVAFFPAATSDLLGFIQYIMHLVFLYTLVALPLAVLCVFVVEPAAKRLSWPDPAVLVVSPLGIGLAAFLVYHLNSISIEGQHIQFPERIDLVYRSGIVAILLVSTLTTRLFLLPAVQRLLTHLPNLSNPRFIAIALCLGLVLVAVWTTNFGLVSVHLDFFAGPVGIAAVGLLLFAVRLGWPRVSRLGRVICATTVTVLACSQPIGPWRDPHSRFVLYAHTPIAGSIASHFRDLVDFDGDGASPRWLGGTDCAEFDSSRGPTRREIPGDGIDQDCSRRDATGDVSVRRDKTAQPWNDCRPASGPLSVVLITIEALRTDAVNPRITPRISHFSKHYAANFTRAYTPATITEKAMASVFGSISLSDSTAPNMFVDERLCVGAPLAELMRQAGYHTAYFNPLGLPEALAQGFEDADPRNVIRDLLKINVAESFMSTITTNDGLDYLERHRSERSFLWLHYVDTHAPYNNPSTKESAPRGMSPYERVVTYVDSQVGRFLDQLSKRGLASRTMVIITADHGEDLGRRGREGHGPDLFEDTIRVPLILWHPGCPARVVNKPVSLSQIGPTIGAFTGVRVPGRNLFASFDEKELPVVAEALFDGGSFSLNRFMRAVIGKRYKLVVDVRNGGRMVFDLSEDIDEKINLLRSRPDEADRIESLYRLWLARPRPTWLANCKMMSIGAP